MTTIQEIFDSLPQKFTSHHFLLEARKHGVISTDEKISTNKEVFGFLIENATQLTTKTWVKKVLGEVNIEHTEVAIAMLKKQGYRVLKPVSDWIEV